MIKIKQVVAFGLAAAMIFGSTITSFAQDLENKASSDGSVTGTTTTVTGNNAVTEYVNMKVFKVMVPTADKMNRVLDYHCDPMDLISQSQRLTVDGRMEGVYFNRYGETGVDYVSNESDELKVINMSSSGVELDYKVSVNSSGVANAYTGSFASESAVGEDDVRVFTGGNIYFGLIATNSEELAIAGSAVADAVTQSNIIYSARDFFRLSNTTAAVAATAAGSYTYAIDSEVSNDDLPSFTFKFIAGLNKKLPETTWFQIDKDHPLDTATAYGMPKIQLQFTPKYIDGKRGTIDYQYSETAADSRLYLYSADESINFAGMTVSDVKVNGKSVSTGLHNATVTDGEYTAPYVEIAEVLKVLGNATAGSTGGTTVTEDERAELNLLSGVEWTVKKGSDEATAVHYYADLL